MSGVVTVVLAAGSGKRLGGSKALLAWPTSDGPAAQADASARPLAIAHAEVRLAAESARVLVVTTRTAFNVLFGYVRPGIDLLVSDAAEELGPAGSLAFAAPRLGDARLVVVTPVDVPPTKAETVARLVARLDGDAEALAARPVSHGRAGHPVVLRRSALARYLEPEPPPLRDHLRALGRACVDVEVEDPLVLLDLDRPADVMGVLRTMPRFFK